ncbi:MAG: hypothetical protein L0216_20605 [Planctomycetales bacterium]|nr:hypothetical protein [Planctomycetales bacterium]
MPFELFWELHQREQIREAASAAGRARSAAAAVGQEIEDLRRLVEKNLMITEALWTLVRDKLGWSDDRLAERVIEVDLKDGQLDGRVRRGARPCAACGRMLGKDRLSCLYCGAVSKDVFGTAAGHPGDAATTPPASSRPPRSGRSR